MKKRSTLRPLGLVLIALAAMAAATAYATGPLYVGGPGAVPGVPYRWTINPLTYWTDLGNLGTQTNQQADTLVASSFQVWQDAPTASITFATDASNGGKLGADVTAGNIMDVLNAIEGCGALGSVAKERSIIYDVDGSAVVAILGQANENSVLGFASAACLTSNGVDNYFQRGYAVLNGRFLDGVDTFSNPEVPADEFKAVMIHEFGHMLGLDHSQINLDCLTGGPNCNLDGLPTMFPIAVDFAAMSTLATDDIAGLSGLYPETVNNPPTQVPYASTTGRITGRIFFSDGQTPAQGFNVIARRIDNPLVIAVSNVSGFLFTACEGNSVTWPYSDCGSSITPFGSRDQDLMGFYYIPGLPPGDYTVGVEAINGTGDYAFVGGSGVGPIGNVGFQFPMPGTCATEFLNDAESATDQCTDSNTRTVAAGGVVSTDTDIILNGTPPRYDAWEDGP
jgi:hypothetical protein